MHSRYPLVRIVAALLAAAVLLLAAASASAESESCREWRAEHRGWSAQVIERYLRGAPQQTLDEAVFEVLQRETWLTSCEASIGPTRAEQVGWRLVERAPDEYAAAVLDSLLARAGFDPELYGLLADFEPMAPPSRAPRGPRTARMRGAR